MTVNCIVQARMGSSRLPGKVMKEIGGNPLIGYLIDRLELCKNIDRTIVAIPERDMNSILGRYLQTRSVDIVQGPEDNVARRFVIALKEYPCDVFVRVCADSPLLDYLVVDFAVRMVGLFSDYHLACFCPGGQAEGFYTEAFLDAVPLMKGDELEHLGLYFKRKYNYVVDTPEDFERVKCLILQQQL